MHLLPRKGNRMANPGKTRSIQHRTDTQGLNIFSSLMPQTEESSWVFTPETSDYGIDGEIQVTESEKHTGEFYKVQIKSRIQPYYSKDGQYVSVSLDIDSVYFLLEVIKHPTALILIDVTKESVYWHPIQTDSELRQYVFDNLDKPSMTVRLQTSNKLTKTSTVDLLNYFREAQLRLAQTNLLESNITHFQATKFLGELEEKTLHYEGFDHVFRRKDDPPTNGVVFSIGYDEQRVVDYVPGKDFRSELLPRVVFTAKFSMKSEAEKLNSQQLDDLVHTGKGSVTLTQEALQSFSIMSGDRVIEDGNKSSGYTLHMSPYIKKTRDEFLLSIDGVDVRTVVDVWIEDDVLRIESLYTEPLIIEAYIKPGSESKINIRINLQEMKSAKKYLRYLDFFKNGKMMDIYKLDEEGFKVLAFRTEFEGASMVTSENYTLISNLAFIEETIGVTIELPSKGTKILNETKDVAFLKELLESGEGTHDISLGVVFDLGSAPNDSEKVMQLNYINPSYTIFGKEYELTGYEQTIVGFITEFKKMKDDESTYKVRLKDAHFKLNKTQTEESQDEQ